MSIEIPENLPFHEESKKVSEIFDYSKNITPINLYRYRNCSEHHIDAFANDKLLLTKPTKFNDPYDALLYINKKEILNKLVNTDVEAAYKHLEKLLHDPIFKQSEIKKMGSEFVESMIMNWTIDGKAVRLSKEELEEASKGHLTRMNLIIELSIKSLKQSSLVACFSENIDSILMWSHYSANHTGFAVNYDFKNLYTIDVGLEKKGSEFLDKKLFPVIYSDERLNATYFAEFNFIYDTYMRMGVKFDYHFYDKLFYYKYLLYKSKNWEYEKEWRIIKQTTLEIDDGKPDFIYIDNIRPKQIYLGKEISDFDKSRLIKIAEKKNIEVFQMEIDYSEIEYKLTAKKI